MASLTKQDEENLIVLHQLKRGIFTPAISPFALKLETFLRMASIPYKTDFDKPMGPKGKTPWISYKSVKMGDSQLIIEFLTKEFDVNLNANLTSEQLSTARAYRVMIEDHLYWAVLIWRWIYDKGRTLPVIQPQVHWAVKYLRPLVVRKIKSDASAQGLGRHSYAEVIEMGVQDLRALASYLGNKKFLMGDKPTEVDCSVFGQLAQLFWSSPGSPFDSLLNDLHNLKSYCDRMKESFWPDWENCLSRN